MRRAKQTVPASFETEAAALAQEAAAVGVPLGKGAALCFSGGGIRSASFCLGVAQALAQAKLLHRFDYLSTVSGGGYIGGWLQQMLAASSGASRSAQAEDVEKRLQATEINELDRLRDFTNYLTPRTGPASPDTWAGVALYGRNFLVNWLVFLPLFLIIALLPILHRTLIWATGASFWLVLPITLTAFVAMGISVTTAARWVPSQRQDEVVNWGTDAEKLAQARARRRVTACALVFAVTLPVTLQYLLGAGWWSWIDPLTETALGRILRMAVGNIGLPLCFFITLVISFEWARARTPRLKRMERKDASRPRSLFNINRESWLWAAGVSSMVFGLLLQVLLWNRDVMIRPMPGKPWEWVDSRADVLTLGAPLVLIGVMLAHAGMYIGWRREARFGDLDREWLARLNGTTFAFIAAWTLFAAACILPSQWITLPDGAVHGVNITMSGLGAILTGALSSWLGKQAVSRVSEELKSGGIQKLMGVVQIVLPLVFVVLLFAFLAALIQDILGNMGNWLPPVWLDAGAACDRVRTPVDCAWSGRWVPVVLQVTLGGLLIASVLKLRQVVNVNRFSMHAVYRNRLVRAFLGTARDQAKRQPDPFTGFDESDNPRLADLTRTGPLYPVINMTLNITTGERGAWSERKGASFVATPQWCGSGALNGDAGAYVPTRMFGGMETDYDLDGKDKGIHLGSVVTISGAAASPNWGYHSSPLIALLMTLFNVRLGAWYANPTKVSADDLQLSKPKDSISAMLNELTGTAREDDQAIYLSDGGHFENLGVYEMLKRRCRRILVIDAGQDEGCAFFDLGMMIRKAEIDLPVKIDLPTVGLASRASIEMGKGAGARGFAFGTVTYYLDDGATETGEIAYLKPTLLPDVPTAVAAYASGSRPFPHETTADQFFSESQFESYRALGAFQGGTLVAALAAGWV
jgi:Patatin-like phospholipase